MSENISPENSIYESKESHSVNDRGEVVIDLTETVKGNSRGEIIHENSENTGERTAEKNEKRFNRLVQERITSTELGQELVNKVETLSEFIKARMEVMRQNEPAGPVQKMIYRRVSSYAKEVEWGENEYQDIKQLYGELEKEEQVFLRKVNKIFLGVNRMLDDSAISEGVKKGVIKEIMRDTLRLIGDREYIDRNMLSSIKEKAGLTSDLPKSQGVEDSSGESSTFEIKFPEGELNEKAEKYLSESGILANLRNYNESSSNSGDENQNLFFKKVVSLTKEKIEEVIGQRKDNKSLEGIDLKFEAEFSNFVRSEADNTIKKLAIEIRKGEAMETILKESCSYSDEAYSDFQPKEFYVLLDKILENKASQKKALSDIRMAYQMALSKERFRVMEEKKRKPEENLENGPSPLIDLEKAYTLRREGTIDEAEKKLKTISGRRNYSDARESEKRTNELSEKIGLAAIFVSHPVKFIFDRKSALKSWENNKGKEKEAKIRKVTEVMVLLGDVWNILNREPHNEERKKKIRRDMANL